MVNMGVTGCQTLVKPDQALDYLLQVHGEFDPAQINPSLSHSREVSVKFMKLACPCAEGK